MTGALIIARAPRPGTVKTRLEPLLGPVGCAGLQATLIAHTVAWASLAADRVWLAFTPGDAREELAGLVPEHVSLFAQASGDLGARLRAATRRIRHKGPLIVIGTDAPLLGAQHFAGAVRRLADGHDACLVPALDGGYALIGLAQPTPAAFALPPAAWGGPDVFALTLAALQRAGLATAVLEPVGDLDTPADAHVLRSDPRCPPAVRAALDPAGVAA